MHETRLLKGLLRETGGETTGARPLFGYRATPFSVGTQKGAHTFIEKEFGKLDLPEEERQPVM